MKRFLWVGSIIGLLFAVPPQGRVTAQQQQQQNGTDPARPVLTLNGDAAVITILIKPDKTADFELVLAKLKEALQHNPKPERKAQAAGWTVFKSTQLAQGNAVYVMRIDPIVKNEEYDITRLIAEVFPVEVRDVFAKYKDGFVGRGITELVKLSSMQD